MDENAFREKLTPRTLQVMDLVAEGRSSREISEILQISHRTVEAHKANAFKLLGASTSIEAAVAFSKSGNLKKGFAKCIDVINKIIEKSENENGFNVDIKYIIETISKIAFITDFSNIENVDKSFDEIIKNKNLEISKKNITDEILKLISEFDRNKNEISIYISNKLSISTESVLATIDEFSDTAAGTPLWQKSLKGRKGYVYHPIKQRKTPPSAGT